MSSPSWLNPEELPEVKQLSEAECWEALAGERIGRLAVTADDGVDIFPVNFMVNDRELFFRSAPGSKLSAISHSPAVAFETDGVHFLTHWSVVVRGTARRMSDEAEIIDAGIQDLSTMTTSDKWNYVRITPTSVTGISFRRI